LVTCHPGSHLRVKTVFIRHPPKPHPTRHKQIERCALESIREGRCESDRGAPAVSHRIVLMRNQFNFDELVAAAQRQIARHADRCQEVSDQYYWPGQLIQNRLCKNKSRTDKAKFQNYKKRYERDAKMEFPLR
jgi:hypothetical protein